MLTHLIFGHIPRFKRHDGVYYSMLKTNDLRYFVAAAETGSLSSAGTSLHISTSSIGHAVNVLE